MEPLVIYHDNCADGFTAAWVATRALGQCELRPAQYGEPRPYLGDVEDRQVYILDFSYPPFDLFDIAEAADHVVMLDHHKSAARAFDEGHNVAENLEVLIDQSRSGARLAWDWFHPGQPAPALVRYVEDRDLWRWGLWYTRDVNAYIASFPKTLAMWDSVAEALEDMFYQCCDLGSAILRYQERLVEQIAENAHRVDIDGHNVPAVNSPILQSELGHKLAEGEDFAAVYFDTPDKGIVSLRSREDGCAVHEVAEKFGGGGHPGAAGFPREPFWRLVGVEGGS